MHGRRKEAAGDAPRLFGHGGDVQALRNGAPGAVSHERTSSLPRGSPRKLSHCRTTGSAVHGSAPQPRLLHLAAQIRVHVGRKFVSEMQTRRRNGPLQVGIEDDDVRVRAFGERAFVRLQAGEPCRNSRHPSAKLLESGSGTEAAPDHGRPHHGKGEAEAADAAPGEIPSRQSGVGVAALQGRRAWGVIGRHHVDNAVGQRSPKRLAIGRSANGRRAFVFGSAIGNFFRGKPQILGAGFDGDGQAALPRFRQQRQRLRAG